MPNGVRFPVKSVATFSCLYVPSVACVAPSALEQRTLLTVPILPDSIHPENLFLPTSHSRSSRELTKEVELRRAPDVIEPVAAGTIHFTAAFAAVVPAKRKSKPPNRCQLQRIVS